VTAAAADIARIAEALERGQPLDPADGAALLAGIRGGSVDQALGLSRATGRHEMIRAAARQFYPGARGSVAADQFHTEWSRYAGSAWQREKTMANCPPRHIGTIREIFWRLLQDQDVLSARQLRRILAICDGQDFDPDSVAP
jgi:hypothetical protein